MSEKKVKFTVIDAIIILIVLAAAVVCAVKIVPSFMQSSDSQKVSFTVMIQSKDKDFADAITVGDNVTISLTEKDGGIVTDVKAEPAKTIVYNSIDGVYSEDVMEEQYDVYVTVEADADVSDLAIMTGGTAIKVGADIPVRGKGYASNGYIIEIDD
ncbi:MAG: DUF4330 domain-containing protein [Oscillospiraceae bacterium]|nr:DUF4330 domain-containing protein [Oscillospiraceae bacterium]